MRAIIKPFILCLFLWISFSASDAFAQADARGGEFRVTLSIPLFYGVGTTLSSSDSRIAAQAGNISTWGFGTNLYFGYRWKFFGFGVEQQLHTTFSDKETNYVKAQVLEEIKGSDAGFGVIHKGDFFFLGATYLLIQEYIPINSSILINLGQGIGSMYGARQTPGVINESEDAVLALKLELGFTYFIQQKYGIGISFEYALGFVITDSLSLVELVNPMLVYRMGFE